MSDWIVKERPMAPCPFCGCTQIRFYNNPYTPSTVACDQCWAVGPPQRSKKGGGLTDPLAEWNERSAPQEPAAANPVVDDLAHLVRQLARSLRRAKPDHDLPGRAMDYLKRKGLEETILRDKETLRQEAFDTLPDDYELG